MYHKHILCYYFTQRSKIKVYIYLEICFQVSVRTVTNNIYLKNSVCTGCEFSNECISYSFSFLISHLLINPKFKKIVCMTIIMLKLTRLQQTISNTAPTQTSISNFILPQFYIRYLLLIPLMLSRH
jgi:hypothetical protein